VTSSSTTCGGVSTGLGIASNKIDCSIGVVKAYSTRVGAGPFPTELLDQTGERLRKIGHEFGTTTGRPRRCGWLDIPVLQYSHMLNNYSSINITKLDVLTGIPKLKIGVSYSIDGVKLVPGAMPSTIHQLEKVKVHEEEMEGWSEDISKSKSVKDLPKQAQLYLKRVEELLKCPVSWVGVGAGRHEMADNI